VRVLAGALREAPLLFYGAISRGRLSAFGGRSNVREGRPAGSHRLSLRIRRRRMKQFAPLIALMAVEIAASPFATLGLLAMTGLPLLSLRVRRRRGKQSAPLIALMAVEIAASPFATLGLLAMTGGGSLLLSLRPRLVGGSNLPLIPPATP